MTLDLFARPALLFLPASNLRAIAKARVSGADLVVLDLEDAVKAEDKAEARVAAIAALDQDWPMPVAVRINGVGTHDHGADLAAVIGKIGLNVVVPSVRTVEELHGVASIISRPPMVMIETAQAVVNVVAIARQSAGLILGTNDLAADLRLPPGARRESMLYAIQATLLAARAVGVPVFDGVFNRLDDPDGFAAEAAESRALGFDGKSLIHPDQIAPCQHAFAPTAAELARAQRLIAASSGGAQRFEGAMIEDLHVVAARRLLDGR